MRDTKLSELATRARETGLAGMLDTRTSIKPSAASFGALKISGRDAATFLHSQLTNEVAALAPGAGNLSARVTRSGALVRYGSLHRLPDTAAQGSTFFMLLERDGVTELLADLGKFAVVEDVILEDVSEQFEWLALQGPLALQCAENVFGALRGSGETWRALSENAVREFENAPATGSLMFVRSLTGDPGCVVALPREAEAGAEVLERLRNTEPGKRFVFPQGAQLAALLDILRIEAGVVSVGLDVVQGQQVLPETGLEQWVVSYAKGCYLGQEIIARIRTYGSVPLVLRGLLFGAAAALEKIPAAGADVLLESGIKVGRLASRTFSPLFEAPIAFAYLDRTHRTPGSKFKIRGTDGALLDAEVRLLPFYRAADTASRVAFLHDRAIRLFASSEDEKAQALLEEALRLDPSFADGYEALGVLLGRAGKFNEAIDIFKRLEEVAPNEPMVHTNLSLFYMKLGDKVSAEEEAAKGTVKQFSRFAGLKQSEAAAEAEAAQKRADAQRKRAMFEEVLEIDPEDPIALFGLGNALAVLKEWDSAERVLAKSCAVQADNSAAYVAHGRALEMLNREEDALKAYRAGMDVASRKGDLMPLKEMERRVLLLSKA